MGNNNHTTANVLILGIESSGKTLLLYSRMKQIIKIGDKIHTEPTLAFNYEEMSFGTFKVNLWDLPGKENLRHLWSTFYCNIQYHGVIFIINYNQKEELSESIDLMHETLLQNELYNCSVLILINMHKTASIPSISKEEGVENDEIEAEKQSPNKKTKKKKDKVPKGKKQAAVNQGNEVYEDNLNIDLIKMQLNYDMIPQKNKDIYVIDLFEERELMTPQVDFENRMRMFFSYIQ